MRRLSARLLRIAASGALEGTARLACHGDGFFFFGFDYPGAGKLRWLPARKKQPNKPSPLFFSSKDSKARSARQTTYSS
jgi:hypothetical protein